MYVFVCERESEERAQYNNPLGIVMRKRKCGIPAPASPKIKKSLCDLGGHLMSDDLPSQDKHTRAGSLAPTEGLISSAGIGQRAPQNAEPGWFPLLPLRAKEAF